MTATEAALYDQKVNGDLRSKMGSLTHKNLPLAIFLEEADLGYPAWSGSTNSKVSNDQIISSLGIGVVRFNDELEPPDVNDFDYEYRVDTDVISSVEVSGGQSDPDNPVTVRFVIQGRTYTVSNVYYPDGDSQLVWVKWHTPSEPCIITIAVSVSGSGTAQSTIICNIVDVGDRPYLVMEGMCGDVADEPPVSKPQPFSMLYTGRLNRRYGIELLLQAMKELPDLDIELWLCGSGEMEEEIRTYAAQDSRIRFFGFLPHEEAVQLQKQATVLVNPRTNQGEYTKYSFPSKTMEYTNSIVGGTNVQCTTANSTVNG